MTIADENNLLDNLPRFVAEYLSRIPILNTDPLSTIAMARNLKSLEHRMLNIELLMDETKIKDTRWRLLAVELPGEHDVDDARASSLGSLLQTTLLILRGRQIHTEKKNNKKNSGTGEQASAAVNNSWTGKVDKLKGRRKVIGATHPRRDGL